MKIVLIHGFNVKDKGKGTIDRLEKHLKKEFPLATIDKDSGDYGWIGLFVANWLYSFTNIIPRIAIALNDADIVITHSNGSHFCMKALRMIRNSDIKIVHFSPALNSRWKFKERFRSCVVFHTYFDKTVNWAKWVPFSSWGNMGKVGALTDDMRVKNVNSDKSIKNHSGWFLEHKIKKVYKRMIQELDI
jgi:hypothetical protein